MLKNTPKTHAAAIGWKSWHLIYPIFVANCDKLAVSLCRWVKASRCVLQLLLGENSQNF